MQKLSELLNIKITSGSSLTIYHPTFKDKEVYWENSNVIYQEDSYGNWVKKEYDSNGNVIYYEDSSGYWTKQEYDSNGNEIYFENSNGYIIDNRPKIKELTLNQIAEKFNISLNQLRIKE